MVRISKTELKLLEELKTAYRIIDSRMVNEIEDYCRTANSQAIWVHGVRRIKKHLKRGDELDNQILCQTLFETFSRMMLFSTLTSITMNNRLISDCIGVDHTQN